MHCEVLWNSYYQRRCQASAFFGVKAVECSIKRMLGFVSWIETLPFFFDLLMEATLHHHSIQSLNAQQEKSKASAYSSPGLALSSTSTSPRSQTTQERPWASLRENSVRTPRKTSTPLSDTEQCSGFLSEYPDTLMNYLLFLRQKVLSQ